MALRCFLYGLMPRDRRLGENTKAAVALTMAYCLNKIYLKTSETSIETSYEKHRKHWKDIESLQ